MNKIIIDEYEKELTNINGCLEIQQTPCHIHLYGNNLISKLLVKNNSKLILTLENNATLKLETLWQNSNENFEFILNMTTKTNLDCRINIETEKHVNLNIQNNIQSDENQSKIRIHVVTEKNGTCKIAATGYIKANTKKNEFLEELKGLTENENSITFLPNLITETNDVTAMHNATIKGIDEEELFYLTTKGISESKAKELIKNGFLNKTDKEVNNES